MEPVTSEKIRKGGNTDNGSGLGYRKDHGGGCQGSVLIDGRRYVHWDYGCQETLQTYKLERYGHG